MTYDEAKGVLREYIDENGEMPGKGPGYVYWTRQRGDEIELDGTFTIRELEAFATYVKGTARGE